MIFPFGGSQPLVAKGAFIAPGAVLIGQVEIAAEASIWFGCVLRGDVNAIRVGARSNLQDGTIVHVTSRGHATSVGADVTVGHRCILHACELQDRAFVGMGATLLDGSVVETGAMLAAGSLLTPGKVVPAGQLWGGRPARFMRVLSVAEIDGFRNATERYVLLAQEYARTL